jgi:hypothetical protein
VLIIYSVTISSSCISSLLIEGLIIPVLPSVPTADQTGGGQISNGSTNAGETPADQTGGGQISDGSPAIVEPTADQTGSDQISVGSPATVEPTAYQSGSSRLYCWMTSIGDLNTTSLINSRLYYCRTFI